MQELLSYWGLASATPRNDIILPGSPERCMQRTALSDGLGRVFILESLHPGQFDSRERIARTLARLHRAGLPVAPYLPGSDGGFCLEMKGVHYQLSPFIPGDPLPQPDFIEDVERGEALGHFLARLRTEAKTIHDFDAAPQFNLEKYINGLMGTIRLRQPDIHEILLPVLPHLAPLFATWDKLPHSLCQGDFHPLNVIWQDLHVAAVIDWEFAGLRPALFDAANCLGCVGMEDPLALVRGLASGLVRTLHKTGCLDEMSFSLLPELLLGLRFAWMSEWLRRNDDEMIDMELRYMRLLANSIDSLLPAWKNIAG